MYTSKQVVIDLDDHETIVVRCQGRSVTIHSDPNRGNGPILDVPGISLIVGQDKQGETYEAGVMNEAGEDYSEQGGTIFLL